MSHEDRKSPEQPGASEPKALLEDLESIRDLLDAELPTTTDDDIPVLREVVLRPAFATRQPAAGEDEEPDLFDARMFADRLLDEHWQQQSNAILASARRTADALTARLAPDASATARERLRSRLASELPPLLEQVVGEAVEELQQRLLRVLRNELTRLTEAALMEHPQRSAPDDEPPHDD